LLLVDGGPSRDISGLVGISRGQGEAKGKGGIAGREGIRKIPGYIACES